MSQATPQTPVATTGRRNALLAAVAIFVVTGAVYAGVVHNDFVDWDDNQYIYQNVHIQHLDRNSLRWMFTTFHASNYHPLTWLSHALDYQMWGLHPGMHHLTSVLLHALNTGLVFLLAWRLIALGRGGRGDADEDHRFRLVAAAVAALLFGLHPVHVESVAWAAERKDVLCALFFLLAVVSYLSFAGRGDYRKRWYLATTVCLVLALLSKPMAVTLPAVLLLLDLYPLGRLRRGHLAGPLLEKLPLFAISGASSVVTFLAQSHGGAVMPIDKLPVATRLLNAVKALAFYLGKLVWPQGFTPLYEYPQDFDFGGHVVAFVVVAAITAVVLVQWRKGRSLLLVAWLYFLITLLPVIGIVQVGRQMAADRYMYLPGISLCLLGGLGVAWLWHQWSNEAIGERVRPLVACGVVAALLLLGLQTIRYVAAWRTDETLWRYAVSVHPNRAFLARCHLFGQFGKHGDLPRAVAIYEELLNLAPDFAEGMNQMGIVFADNGRPDLAIREFQRGLKSDPKSASLHGNIARVYLVTRNLPAAEAEAKRAVELWPEYAQGHRLLGSAYLMQFRTEEAIRSLETSLEYDRESDTAYVNLGLAYSRVGRMDDAIEAYRQAALVDPSKGSIPYQLGRLYYRVGKTDEARRACQRAIALGYPVPEELRVPLGLSR